MCYWDFDDAERVSSIHHVKADGSAVAYFDFERDDAGNIVSVVRESDLVVYYGYDEVNRLTSEVWRQDTARSHDAAPGLSATEAAFS